MTAIAILTLRKMIADAVLAAELMHGKVRRLFPKFLHPIEDELALLSVF